MNNRNMGQMIGLLLLVIAAAFGGYVLGSNDAETVTEVRSEHVAESTDASTAESPDGGDASLQDNADGAVEDNGEVVQEAGFEIFESQSGLPLIFVDELPDEAIDTLILIDDDGPFPYDKDGSTFQNREGLLPDHPQGYYREYTVDTPGIDHRGARRFVGGNGGELYYTDTHYESFSELADW